VPNFSDRIGELRTHYRNTLLTVANEIGGQNRLPINAIALARVRRALGVDAADPAHKHPEKQVRAQVLKYVVSLIAVLEEMGHVESAVENQQAIASVRQDLEGAL
jgi:hypothetical protein